MKHHIAVKGGQVDAPGCGELGLAIQGAVEPQPVQGFTERVGVGGDCSTGACHAHSVPCQLTECPRSLDEELNIMDDS